MRLLSTLGFAAVAAAMVFACSSSDETTPNGATNPQNDGGGSSSGDEASTSSSSSGGSSGAPDGEVAYVKTTTESMDVDGEARKYILSVPLDYDANKKYPLYYWLHGNPGTAENAAAFRVDLVTKNEAIIVYPGAISTDGWDHTAALQDNPDTKLLLALLDEIPKKYNIDKSRVLLSGWSGGGFMSSLMACRFYSSFRAIGIHAGGAPFDPNGGDNPPCNGASIATLVTHGGMDNNVGGDSGFYAAEYWAQHNGCSDTRTATTPSPCETYDGCPGGKPVEYCFNPNGGHGLWDQALAVEWAWFKKLP